jgi:uncharacterized repeat protein (TIGR01451 family)
MRVAATSVLTLLMAAAVAPTASASIAAPQLAIKVTDGRLTAATGETLAYTTTLENQGASAVKRLVISQSIPREAAFVSADSGGAVEGSSVRWTVSLKVGAKVTMHSKLSVSVPPRDVLRLASVSCASLTVKSAPIVCASDLDQLPAGASAAAAAAVAAPVARPAQQFDTAVWWYSGAAVLLATLGAVGIVKFRRHGTS